MSITLYHNPRCSKSRKTLEILESRGVAPRIVEYLSTPPEPAELQALAGLVGVSLSELLRKGESEFVEAAEAVPLDDESALAEWLHAHPRVLQRPIVVDEEKRRAVIGRPPENVLELID